MDITQQSAHLQIIATADGSNTIYNAQVGENYHSRNGALQESRHVFLQSGLQYFLSVTPNHPSSVSILEIGFGTGLNFLLTADFCSRTLLKLHYTGIEAFPLSKDMLEQTGYSEYVAQDIWRSFSDNYVESLAEAVDLNEYCRLQIATVKLQDFESVRQFDIIYFDAFAVAHQPEMWSDAAIAHTIQFLKPGGVFVTYAITGNLKRSIKALGLKVEKAPGAPGKREMLRAVAGFGK